MRGKRRRGLSRWTIKLSMKWSVVRVCCRKCYQRRIYIYIYFLLSIFLFSTSSLTFSAGFIHDGMFQNSLPHSGDALSDMSKEGKRCEHVCTDFRDYEFWQFLAFNLYSACSRTKHKVITYLLTYGAEPLLRSCQLYSHSGTSHHFKEPESSSPCS
jgi:hypothetical protein